MSSLTELTWPIAFNDATHYVVIMQRTSFAAMSCSLARTLELIGDWWTPLIIRDLFLGITRFDDLVEDLGVSRNLLAARLKKLVAQGLVERRQYQDNPPRHDHVLTAMGRALVPPLLALTAWGDRWVPLKGGRPMTFTHRKCGKEFAASVCCSECGEIIDVKDVAVGPGPGGKAGQGTQVIARLFQEAERLRHIQAAMAGDDAAPARQTGRRRR
jgi:DNA-binding HxlR family transcriptional regulator